MGDRHTHICPQCGRESEPGECVEELADCYYPLITMCAWCDDDPIDEHLHTLTSR